MLKSRPRVTLRLSPSSFVGVQRHLFVAECHQSVGGAIHEISSTPLTNIPEIDGFLLTRSSAIAIGFKEHPSYKGFYADVNGSIWSRKPANYLERILAEEEKTTSYLDGLLGKYVFVEVSLRLNAI